MLISEQIMSVQQAAKLTGCSRWSIYRNFRTIQQTPRGKRQVPIKEVVQYFVLNNLELPLQLKVFHANH